MKIRVVVDNNTLIDRYFTGEPAVCYYIETDGERILFDTGYSDVFLKNADAMKIDLGTLTHIVLSHGHNDHTGGLAYLMGKQKGAKVPGGTKAEAVSRLRLIAHPGCFAPKADGDENIGSPVTRREVESRYHYIPAVEPWKLSENCVFLGQIPRRNGFEGEDFVGVTKGENGWRSDTMEDDSALVCRVKDGLFIITGCSHSGICNIVDYAVNVCGDLRIVGILGGFHLFDVDKRLDQTIEHLERAGIKTIYPCHCVSLKAKARMMERLKVEEVGVGMEIAVE